MRKICFTGGGTAGHIMPNVALIEKLKPFNDIFYIGTSNSMEDKIISTDIKFYPVKMCKLIRSFNFKNLLIPFKLIKSIKYCKKILKQEQPDIIVCKGGFVSVPVAIAGKLLKIPIITHESDYSVGLGNKIISKFCDVVCTSFEDTAKSIKKGNYTGTPIRKCFEYATKQRAIEKIRDYDFRKKTILITGGSLGSKTLNDAIRSSLNKLTNYNVVHIVGGGKVDISIKRINYSQFEFVDNIADFFDLADVVITRGGSNAIFELLYMRKNMIIIPLPKAQSRGDQIENAKIFEKSNWASVILEENLSSTGLIKEIKNNIDCSRFNKAVKIPNGTDNIIKIIDEITKRNK